MTKDFLSLAELTHQDLNDLFGLTDTLRSPMRFRPLEGKTVAMIFQKPSLRTRVSFEVGIYQLGGHALFLSQEGIGIGTREKATDIGMLLSRYNSAIVARLFDHRLLVDLAASASIPVINALTDLSHPCQVLADAYTLRQHGKRIKGLAVAFIGDGNNVANSWIELAGVVPMKFTLGCPPGYEPDKEILQTARNAGMSDIAIVHDPAEAVRNADVVYTDVWTSMGQEQESEKRKKAFAGFQVNAALMKLAKRDAVVMHCLPAHRGEEITAEALDGPQSIVFDEAENRLHVQKAVLAKLLRAAAAAQPMNYSAELFNQDDNE